MTCSARPLTARAGCRNARPAALFAHSRPGWPASTGLADRLSLYRAFFTAAAEFADIADDSFGYLGDLRTETWLEYLDIDWRMAGMAPDHYWTDLCGLYVWEDYAIDHRKEQVWFRSAEYSEIPLIEGVLTGIAVEAGSYVLDYQADRAHAARARLPHTAPTHGSGPPFRRTEPTR